MLARANRIVLADDYRNTVRRGRKSATAHCVVYLRQQAGERSVAVGPPRFGFIVSKAVGNAVIRNTIRRRLKAVAHANLESVPWGTDVVIRALPSVVEAGWPILLDEITRVMDKGVKA